MTVGYRARRRRAAAQVPKSEAYGAGAAKLANMAQGSAPRPRLGNVPPALRKRGRKRNAPRSYMGRNT